MKRIAVLGARGLLGSDVVVLANSLGMEVKAFGHRELDIADLRVDLGALAGVDWVVNCAALTDVDKAEADRALAFAVNRDGTRRVAEWCKASGVRLLHVSTDYVFDGSKKGAYVEDDPVNPISIYAESKVAGEQAVRESGASHVIARVQALFGVAGKNFPSTIMSRLRGGAKLKVVEDQVTSPTFTPHLAAAILDLLNCGHEGTVHVSASGSCSWYDFARTVGETIGVRDAVSPVRSDAYPRPAKRPLCCLLDKGRLESWTGRRLPDWREGLKEFIRRS